jgi:hypothetical protein
VIGHYGLVPAELVFVPKELYDSRVDPPLALASFCREMTGFWGGGSATLQNRVEIARESFHFVTQSGLRRHWIAGVAE